MPTTRLPSSHSSRTSCLVVHQVRVGAVVARDLHQPVRVRGVARADHEHQVALARHLADGQLAVGGRVTDVVALGPGDRREALAQPPDDAVGLVHRERGLREVGQPLGIVDLEVVHVLLGLDQDEVVGGLAHRALHLLVALVAHEHDRVALGRELLGLHVHLGHERAGGVDSPEAAGLGVGVHARAPRRGPRTRPSRPPARPSPPPRTPRRGRAAAPPRACCARSPCARTRAGRRARAPARPPARRGPRRRSTRAGRRAAASREWARPIRVRG